MNQILRSTAVLLAVTAVFTTLVEADSPGRDTVSLRSAVIDADLAATTRATAPATGIHLVKFPAPISAGQRQALEARVGRIFTYLPHDAFLVRLSDGATSASLEDVGASWTAPYLSEYKISPEIARTRADDPTLRPVMIHIFPDADHFAAIAAIEKLAGARVEGATNATRFTRARILLSGSEIVRLRNPLAAMPEVFWIEREARKAFFNDTTIWVGQSGTAGGAATPVFDQGILGAGQIVGVLDTGIDIDSCYFRDTTESPAQNECNGGTLVNNNHRKVIAVDFLWNDDCSGGISNSEWDSHDHGTHVAGTVAGDDFAQPGQHNGRDGMAPQAKLVIQDCGYEYNPCADCPGIGCPVIDLNPVFEQPYFQGARIHTNSWGDEEEDPSFGEYTSGSEDADTVMWNHKDYLLMFAAGNNGGTSNTVDSPSTAKSVISVGSTGHAESADSISSFSSRGPTDDGRIKPSITIVGSSVMSANNDGSVSTNNCDDQGMSGTSMASPGAAGLAALVRQYYSDGWYPTGAATPADALNPSAALLRATLINSGQQMAN
ncbi:MAG: S8 family serine peptidase, partial [Acidobacteria bacterium]|nr:S8 family serine peptidase [Acidobacteriota bacterium]